MILTVQSTGNNSFRLGVSRKDSIEIFNSVRGAMVYLYLEKCCQELNTTCGPPLSKGFDLYSKDLSNWIVKHKFNKYQRGNPTKLEFEYNLINEIHTLRFIKVIND